MILHLCFEANKKAISLPRPIHPPVIKIVDDEERTFCLVKIFFTTKNAKMLNTTRTTLNTIKSMTIRIISNQSYSLYSFRKNYTNQKK